MPKQYPNKRATDRARSFLPLPFSCPLAMLTHFHALHFYTVGSIELVPIGYRYRYRSVAGGGFCSEEISHKSTVGRRQISALSGEKNTATSHNKTHTTLVGLMTLVVNVPGIINQSKTGDIIANGSIDHISPLVCDEKNYVTPCNIYHTCI